MSSKQKIPRHTYIYMSAHAHNIILYYTRRWYTYIIVFSRARPRRLYTNRQ